MGWSGYTVKKGKGGVGRTVWWNVERKNYYYGSQTDRQAWADRQLYFQLLKGNSNQMGRQWDDGFLMLNSAFISQKILLKLGKEHPCH